MVNFGSFQVTVLVKKKLVFDEKKLSNITYDLNKEQCQILKDSFRICQKPGKNFLRNHVFHAFRKSF